ncbi:MAG: heme o synthase [Chloroflexota bacterium]|nr:heme o synthase [Chloroflexota bacterium]MDE2908710.1 heme o synthase [Chloroflexota bacterium]
MIRTLRSNMAFGVSPRPYIELMKPRIVILLVFTCVTSMIVAIDAFPPAELLTLTILGGALSAGGASAINQYLDREIDAKMARTARRPIPSGRVSANQALAFGMALVSSSVLVLGLFVNWLAAVLALAGAIYYVVIYTLILKRNTVVNILIGGGAGAMPVLVGWAAASGALELQAFILFAIVFYWTPPHSWALAILVNKDYAAADIPMMPVARGESVTRLQILFYSIQLVIISLSPALLLLLPQAPVMLDRFFLAIAAILGLILIGLAGKLIHRADKATARALYKYSSLYLALLFLAMIFDRLLL